MSETEKNLPDDLREGIEDVRLANHAIRACIRLLAEDSINTGSQADGPMPFIRFGIETQFGLMLAVDVCSKSISRHIDSLEEEKKFIIGWDGSSRPDKWQERSYPPQGDDDFAKRVDQAIARGEHKPFEKAMKEAWAEHDKDSDTPDEKTTIQ